MIKVSFNQKRERERERERERREREREGGEREYFEMEFFVKILFFSCINILGRCYLFEFQYGSVLLNCMSKCCECCIFFFQIQYFGFLIKTIPMLQTLKVPLYENSSVLKLFL